MTRLRLLGVTAMTVGLATLAVAAAGQESTANGGDLRHTGRCSEHTLKGNYGVTLSGLRPGAGGALEQFVGLSMQTYDGQGKFTQVDNTHGPTSAMTDQPGWGTYTVNPDCSGTKTLWLQGLPFPIENRIVVLDRGDEVRIVVMSPAPIVVTATGKRIF
jgi:hypothetical protein